MAPAFLSMTTPLLLLLLLLPQLLLFGAAAAAPQDGQPGYAMPKRIPILYEAYYPEPRQWSPRANLQEIERLRELTNQLLREEEELGKLAAAVAESSPENVLEPRSQILEYVISEPVAQAAVPAAPPANDVQVASITVSDTGHKTRHHHGEPNWLIRRIPAPR